MIWKAATSQTDASIPTSLWIAGVLCVALNRYFLPKTENSVIIYSFPCHSKHRWLSFFCSVSVFFSVSIYCLTQSQHEMNIHQFSNNLVHLKPASYLHMTKNLHSDEFPSNTKPMILCSPCNYIFHSDVWYGRKGMLLFLFHHNFKKPYTFRIKLGE